MTWGTQTGVNYDMGDSDWPADVAPLADYYIIAGVVYQGPDLASVINSRILNTLSHLQSAFDETQSFSKYHPSKGYWWEFKNKEEKEKEEQKKEKLKKKKEEPSSMFQRQRVDQLLGELARKFAPPPPPEVKEEPKIEPKVEKVEKTEDKSSSGSMKPPPEKKAKLR